MRSEAHAGGDGGAPVTAYDEELCSKSFTYVSGGTTVTNYYAEHAYPGKSVNDMARVTAIMRYVTDAGIALPPGYTHLIGAVVTAKDGYVSVNCGWRYDYANDAGTVSSTTYDRVTFVSAF